MGGQDIVSMAYYGDNSIPLTFGYIKSGLVA